MPWAVYCAVTPAMSPRAGSLVKCLLLPTGDGEGAAPSLSTLLTTLRCCVPLNHSVVCILIIGVHRHWLDYEQPTVGQQHERCECCWRSSWCCGEEGSPIHWLYRANNYCKGKSLGVAPW